MTQYARVPARCLHRVPESLSLDHAALTEPCCVAYNSVVGNSRINPGDRVLVIGPGTIGILCAAVAKLCGGDVAVLGLESDSARFEIVKNMAAHHSPMQLTGPWNVTDLVQMSSLMQQACRPH